MQRDPFSGLGKPEPLQHELSGCWSRRINQERRLAYQVLPDNISDKRTFEELGERSGQVGRQVREVPHKGSFVT